MIADKYTVNVEGAIVKDGRYLMIVRGEEEYAPGGLSFPGGKVEGAGNLDDILEFSSCFTERVSYRYIGGYCIRAAPQDYGIS